MDWIPVVAEGALALGFGGAVGALARRAHRDRVKLRGLEVGCADLGAVRGELERARIEQHALTRRVEDLLAEDQRKAEWLDTLERENDWYRQELEKRPKVTRKVYKILTVGISGTGKTALTLKWANPLTDLGALAGTKIDRYERTVSHVAGKDVTTEHVFEIGDWGGEHIVDALQELIMEEIHGLLMVADLALEDGRGADPARVERQLREFQPEALKFFFAPKTLASCKSVVLFINKSDVLSGTPEDVEKQARSCYGKLIQDLEKYKAQLDVRVLVGSATQGHATHHLFAHFVERILPKTAYDAQLHQRMKSSGDGASDRKGRHVAK